MANKYCPQFQMGGTVGEGGWGRALVNENACPWALLIEPPEGASPFEPVTQIIARAWIGGDNIERQYTLAGEQGARDY